jgi:hypothetical protein
MSEGLVPELLKQGRYICRHLGYGAADAALALLLPTVQHPAYCGVTSLSKLLTDKGHGGLDPLPFHLLDYLTDLDLRDAAASHMLSSKYVPALM